MLFLEPDRVGAALVNAEWRRAGGVARRQVGLGEGVVVGDVVREGVLGRVLATGWVRVRRVACVHGRSQIVVGACRQLDVSKPLIGRKQLLSGLKSYVLKYSGSHTALFRNWCTTEP